MASGATGERDAPRCRCCTSVVGTIPVRVSAGGCSKNGVRARSADPWRGNSGVTMVRRVWHRQRAAGVRPELIAFLDAWDSYGEAPFPVVVCPDGGLRTDEAKQHALFVAGKTKAETLANTPHGRGAAVDVAPYRLVKGRYAPDFSVKDDFRIIGEFAEALGLVWGGRFHGFFDGPHIQIRDWRSLPMVTT